MSRLGEFVCLFLGHDFETVIGYETTDPTHPRQLEPIEVCRRCQAARIPP